MKMILKQNRFCFKMLIRKLFKLNKNDGMIFMNILYVIEIFLKIKILI